MTAVAGPVDGLLVGPVSVDRYVASGERLPGAGALNMAYHWSRLGLDFRLVSRVSRDDADLVGGFLTRHAIAHTPGLWQSGRSCTIDVVIGADRQPRMDRFVEGIWGDFAFSDDELGTILTGVPTHLVLVDAVDRELVRRRAELTGSRLSGDFLSFGHFDAERFDASFAMLEVGLIGWPGDPGDRLVDALGQRTKDYGNVLVVTFGSRGVAVYDGRRGAAQRRWFDVEARHVEGTTIGCGDAFIAAFLASWNRERDVAAAVTHGRTAGAEATAWVRPLPDSAYG